MTRRKNPFVLFGSYIGLWLGIAISFFWFTSFSFFALAISGFLIGYLIHLLIENRKSIGRHMRRFPYSFVSFIFAIFVFMWSASFKPIIPITQTSVVGDQLITSQGYFPLVFVFAILVVVTAFVLFRKNLGFSN